MRGMVMRTAAAAAALALALALVPAAGAVVTTGTGIRAVDGDTALVKIAGRTVRVDLAGIAAPAAGECFAATAKRRLQALVAGRRLSVDTASARVGARVKALLYPVGKGAPASANLALVRAGLAEVTNPGRLSIARLLTRAETAAQNAGKAIWGAGCDITGSRGGTTPPPPPPPPPANVPAVTLPAGWVVTAGTPQTVPVPQGRTKEDFYAFASSLYAEMDRQVRGGRLLFFSETLGSAPGPIVNTEIRLDLCSNRTYQRTFQGGLSNEITPSTGTWRITVDLTQADIRPTLERTDSVAGAVKERIDLPTSGTSRVLLDAGNGNRQYTTGPSTVCT
jgi:endonuclease YncB( thermonuclease family)